MNGPSTAIRSATPETCASHVIATSEARKQSCASCALAARLRRFARNDSVLLQTQIAQAQGVADDEHRAHAHRGARDHRLEQATERRIENAGAERDRQPVEDEGEEQV